MLTTLTGAIRTDGRHQAHVRRIMPRLMPMDRAGAKLVVERDGRLSRVAGVILKVYEVWVTGSAARMTSACQVVRCTDDVSVPGGSLHGRCQRARWFAAWMMSACQVVRCTDDVSVPGGSLHG
ncbi:hypothetical protein BV898_12689 [Hypsibius exemplaris]|uniref:Uncharacterized protein n=1 Tax=Hypsibius exemplaris TaxID=2072580 RepID=A0A1W0WCU4_HYPEX|nr:hypothetical protein BV898_12689 [Hypsibius exemplaris]